ncbi:MAG: hypothetical protein R3A80_11825 [Bdellovibrionota bacterium]
MKYIFRPLFLMSFLGGFSLYASNAGQMPLCKSGLADNTVISERMPGSDKPRFHLDRRDTAYIGDQFSMLKKDPSGALLYPQIRADFDRDGIVAAGALQKWREDNFAALEEMDESKFLNILQDAIDTHRNDKQFSSESRGTFLDAIDTWMAAKKNHQESGARVAEQRILLELMGKTEKVHGSEFQPVQADFRNMMGVWDERELTRDIPRVSMPVILSAFYQRYLRNQYTNPELSGEGSINEYVDRYMRPPQ